MLRSGGGAKPKLHTADALSYLKVVKEIFQDEPDKYADFLQIMIDFKAGRTNTRGVITRVQALMKGHPVLIRDFNTFLPKGYEINPLPREDGQRRRRPPEFEDAIDFIGKVKTRFVDDRHVYQSFLDILNMHRENEEPIAVVYEEVSALFRDHQDLFRDFVRFLPNHGKFGAAHQVGEGHGDDGKSYCERMLNCLDATKCKCRHLK